MGALMDFEQARNEFLIDLKLAGRTARTLEGHRLEVARLGRWLEEQELHWQHVTRRDLQRYARLRADKGHSSRSNMLCSLRTFYRWAVEQELIGISPAAGFKTPTRPHPLPRALSLDGVRQLVAALQQAETRTERRDRALLITALYTGLRAAELAKLHWSDIDRPAGLLNLEISKMQKGRSVPLHPAALAELDVWREAQAGPIDGPVFSLDSHQLKPERVGKIAKKWAARSGLRFTAHTLRHTFATWTLRHSRDLYAVSKALGHSRVQQTEIYLAADVEQVRTAVDLLPDVSRW